MLVYVVTLLVIAVYAGTHKNINKNNKTKSEFLILSFGLLIIVAALRDESVGRDLAAHYAENFRTIAELSWSSLAQFSNSSGYELGYVYFCKLLSVISSNTQWFIFAVSVIIFGSLGRFIYKNSEDVVFSTFLVIFSCVYYMFLTMIRQGLAISILLLGYEILNSERKRCDRYIKFIFVVMLATCFHQSAILGLIFILFDFFKFKKEYIILAVAGTLFFYFMYDKIYLFVLQFMGNSERYMAHISSATEGVGSIDKLGLINIILTSGAFFIGYYSLIWHKKRFFIKMRNLNDPKEILPLAQKQTFFMYAGLCAGIFRLLATQMNILNRVTYYFLPFIFVLYPMAFNGSRRYGKILKFGVFFAYIFYYIVMSVKVANSYYGAVPYIFFWQV